MREADAVIHAGDIATLRVLKEIDAISRQLHAVHGNVDEPELRRLLPATQELEFEGHRIAVTHDAGPAKGRIERLAARFPQAEAVIFGHSHVPVHERRAQLQIFNPGSPTERRRAPHRAMGLLRVGREIDFEHVWLES
jgi:putative phosphoesterase